MGRILYVRGEKVVIDADLAVLYGVTTKRRNEQVRRNQDRFPPDFAFTLTDDEKAKVVANCGHLIRLRYSPRPPMAFTEHGALMAASVLNTPRAVEMSVYVVRVFVRLRTMLSAHKELAAKVAELEERLSTHDTKILAVIDAIKQLMGGPPPAKRGKIGFIQDRLRGE